MPVPRVRAVGAITSGTGTITLGEPAGTADGDLQIMQIECDPADAAVTCTGWTHIPGSPVNQDSALTTDTRLSMLYRVRSGAGTLTTNDPGDHIIGRMINIMAGTYDQGNPFNAIGTGTDTTEDTSASVPGAVTTIRDCLILIAIASGFDRATNATNEYSGFTNAALTNIVEQIDNARIDGNGGTIGMASASYAGPGDYGATTATLANAVPEGDDVRGDQPGAADGPSVQGIVLPDAGRRRRSQDAALRRGRHSADAGQHLPAADHKVSLMTPTLGLAMIVRDEEQVIGRALDSVRELIGSWTIIDTGSTDRTCEIVAERLDGIPGSLLEQDWTDFGANLSELMAQSREQAKWNLRLHADMEVDAHDGLLDFLAADEDSETQAWQVGIEDPGGYFYRCPYLTRGGLEWWYEGATHEYLAPLGRKQRPLLGLTLHHRADGANRAAKFGETSSSWRLRSRRATRAPCSTPHSRSRTWGGSRRPRRSITSASRWAVGKRKPGTPPIASAG